MDQMETINETPVNTPSKKELDKQINQLAGVFAEKELQRRAARAKKIAAWKAAKGIKD